MITLRTLELELNRETQSMRSFYLGVQNFDTCVYKEVYG